MSRLQQDNHIEMDDDAGPVGYWVRVAAGKLPFGGRLAHMGLALSSIPAMCTEAERVFDGYVQLTRRSQFVPPRMPTLTTAGDLAACLHLISGVRIVSDPDAGIGDDMIEATKCLKSWSAA